MRYLIDTPVISELVKPDPEPKVARWAGSLDAERVYTSVVTFGELAKGIEKLTDGRRKRELLRWVESDLKAWFGPRVLAVDLEVAERWGLLLARAQAAGRSLPAVDALIAATALAHGLVLVTRNTRHFGVTGLEVLNPWQES